MGKYGRPKLPDNQRREAGALFIRLNQEERKIVEEKASQAGVTPHEWARLAALERNPPTRTVIPELNSEAWHRMAPLLESLERASRRLQPGLEGSLWAAVEGVRVELTAVRNLLIEGQP